MSFESSNKALMISESQHVAYFRIKEINEYKNPCMIIMFGGDKKAIGVAASIGIYLEDVDISSIIESYDFIVEKSKYIPFEKYSKKHIKNNAIHGCLRVIAIGYGMEMVFDQNIKMITAMFN